MRRLLFALLATTSILLTAACPQAVRSLCQCEELPSGVNLNCSDAVGADVVMVLKAHQAQLGLIQQLIMQRANIRRLGPGYFGGLFIRRLDLSYNRMTEIDDAAFVGMSAVIQEIMLHHNALTSLPTLQLAMLKTLLRLDVSNNSIASLEQEHALPALPKLFDLNLANNRICSVHKAVFDNVKASLQTINLGHNCLKAVPASALRGFKQLQALHLHHNDIEKLDALSFMNLPQLNLLNLAHNVITEITRQAFLNVPNLRYLYLTENKLTTLQPHQWATFDQLEMIDFTNNFLLSIPTAAFSGLKSIRQLYLGSNKILTVEPGAFANSSLVILILSGNRLTELSEHMLDGLPALQQISLRDNQITSIHSKAFYETPSLVMVDLAENGLVDLPPAVFLAQLSLLLVDLTHNKLVRTPFASFNQRVSTVLLQENPLVCTERIHMLQENVGVRLEQAENKICGDGGKGNKKKASKEKPEHANAVGKQLPSTGIRDVFPSKKTSEVIQSAFLQDRQVQQLQSLSSGNSAIRPISAVTKQAQSRESTSFERFAPSVSQRRIAGHVDDLIQEEEDDEDHPAEIHDEVPDEGIVVDSTTTLAPIDENPPPTRPSILNVRPPIVKPVSSRSRSPFGPEMGLHRPSSIVKPRPRFILHSTTEPSQPPLLPKSSRPPIALERDQLNVDEHSVRTPFEQEEEGDDGDDHGDDEEPLKEEEELELPTRAPGDPAGRPGVIHPFPVPFLKAPPHLSTSRIATSPASPPASNADNSTTDAPKTTTTEFTLPPSIVLAPANTLAADKKTELSTSASNAFNEDPPVEPPLEQFPLKVDPALRDPATRARTSPSSSSARLASPTRIIAICLATVAIVMAVVFVGLCIARHRQMRRFGLTGSSYSGSSSEARTNAYVAAQAAHLHSVYGTLERARSGAASVTATARTVAAPTEHSPPGQHGTTNAWIYSPASYTHYYK